MSNNIVEYFENVLYSQPKVDNFHMSQREIVVLVDHGYSISFVRNKLWELCQKLESKLGLEYSFNDGAKIFTIINRDREKIYTIRIYVRFADDILVGLRPDVIVAYGGSFGAEQMKDVFYFIQRHNHKNLKLYFFNR